MGNLILSNLRTQIACISKKGITLPKKPYLRNGDLIIKFHTLPFKVDKKSKKISVHNGNIAIEFELNTDMPLKDPVNRCVERIDASLLNLDKLKRITTTIILYCPLTDGTVYAESECVTLCGEGDEDVSQTSGGGGEGVTPPGDEPPKDENDPTG